MIEQIKHLWTQLESNSSAIPGLFKLRYSDTSKCDAFLGVKFPEAYRMFILKAPLTIGKGFHFRYEFKGLKFEKAYDPDDSSHILLNLVLVEKQFSDVFDTLVSDLLLSIINETDIYVILKNYSNRLTKWQSLFEKFKQQGLTPEEQRGLFGELHFLRKFLQNCTDFRNVMKSWVGAQKQIRDFQFGRWSVEVKTTHGNNHQKIQISSERQLDIRNLDNLFLYHLSLDLRQQSGETLNQIVDTITKSLSTDFVALGQFNNKLIEGGYFENHRPLYAETGYFARHEVFYNVRDTFPRIEETDIRDGVGDVNYSIITSQCSQFVVSEVELFDKLLF